MIISQVIADINKFIYFPDDVQLNISFSRKISIFFSTFLYNIIVSLFFILLIFILDKYIFPITSSHKITGLTLTKAILWGGILVPIIEEFLFRFPLKYKRNYIFIAIEKVFDINLYKFWKKHFRVIFYLIAIGFGYIHLSNYLNSGMIFLLF